MRAFFDTNVFVYLFDADAPEKQHRAGELLRQTATEGRVLLSTQVLQEFYVAVTRKLAEPLSPEAAMHAVRDLSGFAVTQVDPPLILAAIEGSQRYRFSFWDSLILQSALQGGAEVLYTEDLQHGQRIEGLQVRNPFMDEYAGR
ncbi:PIN domain-containing protein [Arhodomonas sp. SL1]|uniref:PIN domain-containing protein n=1 Tax=Arhodomonas sp. SL1 TaxID=3425691 RepID=UPI003F8820E9